MAQLTVLYIHSSAELYGSDVALLNLVTRLPETIRPIVVLPEEGPLAVRLRERGIATRVFPLAVPRRYYYHPCRFHRLLLLPLELLVCWWRMRGLIRSEKVDLAHVNVSILVGAAWIVRRCGVPLVWQWREVLPERGRWRDLTIRAAEQWATRILCISNAVRAQFRDPGKTAVVFDAVVPEQAPPADPARLREALGLKPGDLCVGAIGRLQFRKGQDVLLRAAPQILQRIPNAVFLIVGDVYKKNVKARERLEHLADHLGIRERVVFTGFREDIRAVMELLDVFVLPARLPEGFGIVQIEAMFQSKPVVATNIGGSLDAVVPGETGFLVPPDDPSALAARIVELLENPALRETMGRKGRQRVLDRFTIERQVGEVVKIYDEAAREASMKN
jgi:glycosyltransferase involved in cell wall biosynthesis